MINPNQNPYTIVAELERRIAEWTGAPYAVAVESGSAAILLSLLWRKEQRGSIGKVFLPRFTYPSAPCSVIFAGGEVGWRDGGWKGEYELYPLNVWDSALRFRKDMYRAYPSGAMQCLSFHIKKRLPVGRGGMILLDDKEAYEWLKRARFDGRSPVPLKDDNIAQLGLNAYMEPTNAARAIQLFELIRDKDLPDLDFDEQGYSDLSRFAIYNQ
jgi:dTDP-4-amino-4,6-dideoxygalactose transaminase